MNTKNSIFDELETVAPTLINVPRTLLYSLQAGYFDNLSTTILNKIKADNKLISSISILDTDVISAPFTVPKHYFENFATNVLTKLKTEDDNFELIPVAPVNPYQVSSEYFNNLPHQILERVTFLENSGEIFDKRTNKTTPYKIPIGYFDDLSNEILNKIKKSSNEEIDSNAHFTKANPYSVPVGYFNNLSAEILDKIIGLDYKEVESNKHFTKANPYSVPVGYFNNLSVEILNKVIELGNEEIILNDSFTKTNPYKVPVGYFENLSSEMLFRVNPSVSQDVPEGYFDSLPTILLQKIRSLEVESELNEIAPLLNTIDKKPVNYVPARYFETLEPALPQAVPAKVIGIKRKINWFKNAVAACLIGTLGFTAYQIMDTASTKNITSIQTASNEKINIKIPTENINVDEELSKVDDASLSNYLNNIEMPTEQATAHFNDVNSGDVDEALQDISDETIQQHLEETGGLSKKKD